MDAGDTSIDSATKLTAWFITGSVTGTTPTNLAVLKWTSGSSNVWLADGTRISFSAAGAIAGCGAIPDPATFDIAAAPTCWALIDTNGDKGPNTLATAAQPSDIYVVGISNSGVVPVRIFTGGMLLVMYRDINNNLIKNINITDGNNASYSVMAGAT